MSTMSFPGLDPLVVAKGVTPTAVDTHLGLPVGSVAFILSPTPQPVLRLDSVCERLRHLDLLMDYLGVTLVGSSKYGSMSVRFRQLETVRQRIHCSQKELARVSGVSIKEIKRLETPVGGNSAIRHSTSCTNARAIIAAIQRLAPRFMHPFEAEIGVAPLTNKGRQFFSLQQLGRKYVS
ncbi:hypothetical protein Mmc1_2674 [Magnetococcus marinus MC-1]|uniref:Uncharacterized protein n=1 Tax=Magnetococcus marinus (strain ATCC BAA-1437 / JCM 17883 / MC-1) TaxID=156889 RepID=A0LB27_MAGMM|nr:hypothetical protein [Magnetococcus marinus]ABK45170.1 hypothetical protein Mmc1_2674 [Magnetococcus marinus MC-1]